MAYRSKVTMLSRRFMNFGANVPDLPPLSPATVLSECGIDWTCTRELTVSSLLAHKVVVWSKTALVHQTSELIYWLAKAIKEVRFHVSIDAPSLPSAEFVAS